MSMRKPIIPEDEMIGLTWMKSGRLDVVGLQVFYKKNYDYEISYDYAKQLRRSCEIQHGMVHDKSEMVELGTDQGIVPSGWYPRGIVHKKLDEWYNEVWTEYGGKNKVDGIRHMREALEELFDNTKKNMDSRSEIYLMMWMLKTPEEIDEQLRESGVDHELLPLLPRLLRARIGEKLYGKNPTKAKTEE